MNFALLDPAPKHYSQGDQQWKYRILGQHGTIGRKGCALTSISMVGNYLIRDYRDSMGRQPYTNPAIMDSYFDKNWFAKGKGYYSDTDLVVWDTLVPFLKQFDVMYDSTLSVTNKIEIRRRIITEIDKGIPVIGGVSYGYDKGRQDHWVVIVGYSKEYERIYPMLDPATKYGNYYEHDKKRDNIIGLTKRKRGYFLNRIIYLKE